MKEPRRCIPANCFRRLVTIQLRMAAFLCKPPNPQNGPQPIISATISDISALSYADDQEMSRIDPNRQTVCVLGNRANRAQIGSMPTLTNVRPRHSACKKLSRPKFVKIKRLYKFEPRIGTPLYRRFLLLMTRPQLCFNPENLSIAPIYPALARKIVWLPSY
jgi:hypothetical protein